MNREAELHIVPPGAWESRRNAMRPRAWLRPTESAQLQGYLLRRARLALTGAVERQPRFRLLNRGDQQSAVNSKRVLHAVWPA